LAKRSFYRAANAVFGKVAGRSSENVILQLIVKICKISLEKKQKGQLTMLVGRGPNIGTWLIM